MKPTKLKDALQMATPERAAEVAQKYTVVMTAINEELTAPTSSEKKLIARRAKIKLDNLAQEIVVAGESRLETVQYHNLVQNLDDELTTVHERIVAPKSTIALSKRVVAERTTESAPRNDKASFESLRKSLSGFSIALPAAYYQEYLKTPEETRVRADYMKNRFAEVFKLASRSSDARLAVNASAKEIVEIIAFYINGDKFAGDEKLDVLLSNLTTIASYERARSSFKRDTGFSLPNAQIDFLFGALRPSGITPRQAIKIIGQAVKLAPEKFSNLKLEPEQLAQFLLNAVLLYNSGSKRAHSFLETYVGIQASISSKEDLARRTIENKKSFIGQTILEMQQDEADIEAAQAKYDAQYKEWKTPKPHVVKSKVFRGKAPDRQAAYHKRVSKMKKIAEARRSIVSAEKSLLEYTVERDLITAYLLKPRVQAKSEATKAVINEILAAKSFDELRTVSNKYKISSQSLYLLRAAEVALVNADRAVKESAFTVQNSDKMYEALTGHYVDNISYAMTQEVVENYKEIVVELDRLDNVINAEAKYFEGILAKYASLEKVPKKLRPIVSARLVGYLSLLNQAFMLDGRLLATYTSGKLLDPTLVTSKDTSTEVALMNKRKSQMADVANFLGIKDFEAPTVESVSVSPLYGPLLDSLKQKYVRGYSEIMQTVASNLETVIGLQNHVPTSKKGMESQARVYGAYVDSIKKARSDIALLLDDLVKRRDSIKAGKDPFVKDNEVLAKHWLAIVEGGIKELQTQLADERSAIGLPRLALVEQSKKKLDDAANDAMSDTAKQGLIFAAIFVGAVSSAVLFAFGANALMGTAAATSALSAPVHAVTSFALGNIMVGYGGVLGQRATMTAIRGLGISDFGGQDLWNWSIGSDALKASAFSAGITGGALLLRSGLRTAAFSSNRLVPSRLSGATLETLDFAGQAINPERFLRFSPTGWFARTPLGRFFASSGHELIQETTEEVAGALPGGDAFVAMLGIKGKVDTSRITLSGAGNRVDNGPFSELSLSTRSTNPNPMTGLRLGTDVDTNPAVVDVHLDAATEAAEITPLEAAARLADGIQQQAVNTVEHAAEVEEVASVPGIEVVGGKRRVSSAGNILPAVNGLKGKGFLVTKVNNGLRVMKGAYSTVVEITAPVFAQFNALTSRIEKDSAALLQLIGDSIDPMPILASPKGKKLLISLLSSVALLSPNSAHAVGFLTDMKHSLDDATRALGDAISGLSSVAATILEYGGYGIGIYYIFKVLYPVAGDLGTFWRQMRYRGGAREGATNLETIVDRLNDMSHKANNAVKDSGTLRLEYDFNSQSNAAAIESLKEVVSKIEERLADADKKIKEARQEVEDQKDQLPKLPKLASEIVAEIETARRELEEAKNFSEDALTALNNAIQLEANATTAYEAARTATHAYNDAIARYRGNNYLLRSDIADASNELAAAQDNPDYQAAHAELEEARAELEKSQGRFKKKKREEISCRITELENLQCVIAVVNAQQRLDELTATKSAADTEINELRRAMEQASAAYEAAESELNALGADAVRNARTHFDSAQSRLEEAEHALKDLEPLMSDPRVKVAHAVATKKLIELGREPGVDPEDPAKQVSLGKAKADLKAADSLIKSVNELLGNADMVIQNRADYETRVNELRREIGLLLGNRPFTPSTDPSEEGSGHGPLRSYPGIPGIRYGTNKTNKLHLADSLRSVSGVERDSAVDLVEEFDRDVDLILIDLNKLDGLNVQLNREVAKIVSRDPSLPPLTDGELTRIKSEIESIKKKITLLDGAIKLQIGNLTKPDTGLIPRLSKLGLVKYQTPAKTIVHLGLAAVIIYLMFRLFGAFHSSAGTSAQKPSGGAAEATQGEGNEYDPAKDGTLRRVGIGSDEVGVNVSDATNGANTAKTEANRARALAKKLKEKADASNDPGDKIAAQQAEIEKAKAEAVEARAEANLAKAEAIVARTKALEARAKAYESKDDDDIEVANKAEEEASKAKSDADKKDNLAAIAEANYAAVNPDRELEAQGGTFDSSQGKTVREKPARATEEKPAQATEEKPEQATEKKPAQRKTKFVSSKEIPE